MCEFVCLCVEKERECLCVCMRAIERQKERERERAADGSEDHLIHCFKEGEPCAAGREMLAQARQGEQEDNGEAEQQEEDDGEEFENELVVEDDDDDYEEEEEEVYSDEVDADEKDEREDGHGHGLTVVLLSYSGCLPFCFLYSCSCYFFCVSQNKLQIYKSLLFSIWPYIVYLPHSATFNWSEV